MSTFPIKQDEVTALANTIISGLGSDPIFANPPASAGQLTAELTEFNEAAGLADIKRAEAEQATTVKKSKFGALTGSMKNVLDWAVKIPNITAAQLKKLGWDFPNPPTPLQIPAQCPNFRLHHINGHTLDFDWDKPSYKDAGRPSGFTLYKRRATTSDAWTMHHTTFGTGAVEDISNFESGTWDVMVRASNPKGEGPDSNIVTVTVG